MLTLRRLDRDPPKGWRFICSDNFEVRAGYWQKLVEMVKKHYLVNGMEIPENLEAIIQDQLCNRIPESFCKGEGPRRFFPTRKQITSGTRLLGELCARRGDAFVTQMVADQRASACVQCRHNTRMAKCRGCEWAYKLIARFFKDRHTRYDGRLYACAICGCLNRAQIHCIDEILIKTTPKNLVTEYPRDICWKRDVLEPVGTGKVKQHGKR